MNRGVAVTPRRCTGATADTGGDINLAGSQVFPVAQQLLADGIPFLFASGYGDPGLPPEFRGRLVLQKPYLPATLTGAVAALLV